MRRRSPRGQRPYRRAMFVLAQLSSTHTKAVRVEIELPVEPCLTPDQDVRALLLDRVRDLFLRV